MIGRPALPLSHFYYSYRMMNENMSTGLDSLIPPFRYADDFAWF